MLRFLSLGFGVSPGCRVLGLGLFGAFWGFLGLWLGFLTEKPASSWSQPGMNGTLQARIRLRRRASVADSGLRTMI